MRIAANAIAAPLDDLRRALARVERGDLESDLTVDAGIGAAHHAEVNTWWEVSGSMPGGAHGTTTQV